jgi:hypothetical protein
MYINIYDYICISSWLTLVITVTFVCQNVLNIISSTSVSRSIRVPNHSHLNVCCVTILYLFFVQPFSSHFCVVKQFYVHYVIVVIFILVYTHTHTHQVRKFSIWKTVCIIVQWTVSVTEEQGTDFFPPVTEGFRFMQVLLVWTLWTVEVFL